MKLIPAGFLFVNSLIGKLLTEGLLCILNSYWFFLLCKINVVLEVWKIY